MQIRTSFALAAAALALGVPLATAAPDGYQPQLRENAQPDGYQPQLRENAQPDAIDRHLAILFANDGRPDGFQPQLRSDAGPDAVDRYLANEWRTATTCR